jgi:DNA-directed RNA polymerase III subunit RPC2
MVKTKTIELSNFDRLPAGQNASVAIMSYTGYDIEDAVILNQASLDRGFGRAMYMRRYQTNLKKYSNGANDILVPPPELPPVTDKKFAMMKKFRTLDKDGISRIGEELQDGDVYMHKHTPDMASCPQGQVLNKADLESLEFKPESQSFKNPLPAYVDRVILTANFEEKCLMKMITRQTRIPELGDKFSSRHG